MGRDDVGVGGGRDRGEVVRPVWHGMGFDGRRMDGAECQRVSG